MDIGKLVIYYGGIETDSESDPFYAYLIYGISIVLEGVYFPARFSDVKSSVGEGVYFPQYVMKVA